MKKFVCLLLVLMALALNVNAYDAIIDGMYFNLNEEDLTATITHKGGSYGYSDGMNSYTGTEVVVPKTVVFVGKTYNVVAVNSYAFYMCPNLTRVVLHDGILSIGSYAFNRSTSLIDIVIPIAIENVGEGAFGETPWFDNLPDGCVYVGTVLYQYKGEPMDVVSVEVKEGTTSISNYAFSSCMKMSTVTLPSSLKKIGKEAFYSCSSIKEITIPENVVYLGDGCFNSCTYLESIVLPEGLEYIGDKAFNKCTRLTEIVIPHSVKTLGWGCFKESGLISAIVGDGVEEIPSGAFAACNLMTVKLGKSVKKIDSYAFSSKKGAEADISTFVIDADTAPYAAHDAFIKFQPNCNFQVPCGSYSSYHSLTLPYANCNVTENIYSLNVYSNYFADDTWVERVTLGHILFHKMPSCQDNVAKIEAVPYFGNYKFVHWSDGSTDNPRTIELYQDTMFYAIFAEKGTDLDYFDAQEPKIYSKDNTLFVEENEMDFRITTTDGRVIFCGREQQIVLPKGLYLIVFEDGFVHKFVI